MLFYLVNRLRFRTIIRVSIIFFRKAYKDVSIHAKEGAKVKIESYSLGMSSHHELEQSIRIAETRTRAVLAAPETITPANPADPAVAVTISPQAQEALREERAAAPTEPDDPLQGYLPPQTYLKKLIVEELLKQITGKRIHISLSPFDREDEEAATDARSGPAAETGLPSLPVMQGNYGFPVALTMRRVAVSEKESLSFAAAGQIRTADGREITFSADLKMQREITADNMSLNIGRAIDPLVLNFDRQGARLGQEKYQFDLNSDGVAEDISFVSSGSGFLALDANHDGQINDGKELFGPTDGNGFLELAYYDQDQNGWIDENDPIFNQLQVWQKDAAGRDLLFSLRDKGVGAICVGSVKAEFTLENQGQTQGLARRAGVFLAEDGGAGTLQQIDLVV